jgi:steroid delta-isomerase-like uncharacterized protein
MTQMIAFTFPILPGKTDAWQTWVTELTTTRQKEFVDNRRRLGARERTYLQQTPHGDVIIVTVEADDPLAALIALGQETDEFTEWFLKNVKELHGVDLREPMPGPPPKLMAETPDPNIAICKRFVDEVLNGKNIDVVDELFAPNYINHLPGSPVPLDIEATKQGIGDFFVAFPDLHIDVHEYAGANGMVVIRETMSGTQTGPLRGFPPSGKRITTHEATVMRVENGKIVEDWPNFDLLSLMRQIGALALPELQPA